ncbi:hypothetical protein PaG_03807 [Moesziomyces aphidis]|uniref:Uncharacterized protein n=1 Tax=Moesziomyces aphidis TaxID=84754 RepID=W3VL60_MOEAP|nr:hypothetical protein PaG_03807 [Moesziomyces aphidis]
MEAGRSTTPLRGQGFVLALKLTIMIDATLERASTSIGDLNRIPPKAGPPDAKLSIAATQGSFRIDLFSGGGFGFLASVEDGKVSPSVVPFRVHLIPTGKEPWDKARAAGLDLLGPAAGASGIGGYNGRTEADAERRGREETDEAFAMLCLTDAPIPHACTHMQGSDEFGRVRCSLLAQLCNPVDALPFSPSDDRKSRSFLGLECS